MRSKYRCRVRTEDFLDAVRDEYRRRRVDNMLWQEFWMAMLIILASALAVLTFGRWL